MHTRVTLILSTAIRVAEYQPEAAFLDSHKLLNLLFCVPPKQEMLTAGPR